MMQKFTTIRDVNNSVESVYEVQNSSELSIPMSQRTKVVEKFDKMSQP